MLQVPSVKLLPGGVLEACLLCHGACLMEQPPVGDIDGPGPVGLQENSEDLALPVAKMLMDLAMCG